MTDMTLDKTKPTTGCTETEPARWTAGPIEASHGLAAEAFDGCRTDTFCAPQGKHRIEGFRLNSPYGLSGFVGVVTYLAYGALNQAWTNPALIAIALFLFLTTPLYSKYSNRIEAKAAKLTTLETGGRIARFLFQLLDNLFLVWVFVAGQVIDPSALDGIGGFFATAAWITIVSQGGQYLAGHLARKGIGNPDHNVVWAIAISVTVSAVAISGVGWIQPAYVVISLGFGALIFGIGLVADTKLLLDRQ